MTDEARVFSFRRRRTAEDPERRALLEGLGQTRALIAQAYAGFNAAGDPDLIESYVFEINALQARYSYLLRRVERFYYQNQPLYLWGLCVEKGVNDTWGTQS